MLQKDRSATTSSKSATSSPKKGLETPIQFVKGVGPKLGALLASRGISTVGDLLFFFPRAYEDRSRFTAVSELTEGMLASVSLEVVSKRVIPLRGQGRRSILDVRCRDESGFMSLKYFHHHKGLEASYVPGRKLIATGNVKIFRDQPEMVHPEIIWSTVGIETGGGASAHVGRVVPIYVELEGIPSRAFRKILWSALESHAPSLQEDLPDEYVRAHHLPSRAESVRFLHFPELANPTPEELQKIVDFATPAHQRLVYEEFFKFEYLVLRQRLKSSREEAPRLDHAIAVETIRDLQSALPFQLTRDQDHALTHILNDFCRENPHTHPMNRMLQGDVGSGKTAVALLTGGAVIAQGGQVALMAPTEILAEQHYRNAVRYFGTRFHIGLLTGRTPQSERRELEGRLSAGEPMLLIGTHALIEDSVRFKNLDYIVIDEQHRFGVEQRRKLREKGIRAKLHPHMLVMSATPIPRTLSLTVYGDLDVTRIKELPPGRSPVKTYVIPTSARRRAYEKIRGELRAGRQAYFIYPLIEGSEAEGFQDLKSAIEEAEHLAHEVFPEFKVGILHGRLKSDEKADVMARFQKNQLQVLVSTTVVEVGVDVPNATIMVVEHPERFGLSQLHQLRGRVGRGSYQSYCFLMAAPRTGETSLERMKIMETTTDGFEIAEADLKIRGPGEFLGTRQSGALPFRLADLVRDHEWLFKARQDAIEMIQSDPDLTHPSHQAFKEYLAREGKIQFERLRTS